MLGLYDPSQPTPFTPGFEVAGTILSVGTDADNFKVGDRVWGIKRFNCYATHVNISAKHVRHLKPEWSFSQGAAFPAQTFTAWYALNVLGGLPMSPAGKARPLTSSRRAVLIHSAAGGVGMQLVAMVKHMNGIAVCTVGSEEKVDRLRNVHGVPRERIIVRGSDDAKEGFETVVRERALGGKGGLDVVVDSIMGGYFKPGYNLLDRGGRYIVMGSASLMPKGSINLLRISGWKNLLTLGWRYLWRPHLDLVGSINENKTVSGFNVGSLFDELDLMAQGFSEVEEMDLPAPYVGAEFPFEKAVEALHFFQSGASIGKLVLTIPETK